MEHGPLSPLQIINSFRLALKYRLGQKLRQLINIFLDISRINWYLFSRAKQSLEKFLQIHIGNRQHFCTQHPQHFFTAYTTLLHSIHNTSTQYPQHFYTASTTLLHSIHNTSTQHPQHFCTASTTLLHSIHNTSTQHPQHFWFWFWNSLFLI